jgi:uncharacterized protein with GYD domain
MLFVACYEYTPEAWSRLLARPADRTQPVRDAMAEAGATLRNIFFNHDDLSGMTFFEAPDVAAGTAIGLVIMGSGAFQSVRVRQLMTAAELPDVLARARKVSERFRAPGEEAAA